MPERNTKMNFGYSFLKITSFEGHTTSAVVRALKSAEAAENAQLYKGFVKLDGGKSGVEIGYIKTREEALKWLEQNPEHDPSPISRIYE